MDDFTSDNRNILGKQATKTQPLERNLISLSESTTTKGDASKKKGRYSDQSQGHEQRRSLRIRQRTTQYSVKAIGDQSASCNIKPDTPQQSASADKEEKPEDEMLVVIKQRKGSRRRGHKPWTARKASKTMKKSETVSGLVKHKKGDINWQGKRMGLMPGQGFVRIRKMDEDVSSEDGEDKAQMDKIKTVD